MWRGLRFPVWCLPQWCGPVGRQGQLRHKDWFCSPFAVEHFNTFSVIASCQWCCDGKQTPLRGVCMQVCVCSLCLVPKSPPQKKRMHKNPLAFCHCFSHSLIVTLHTPFNQGASRIFETQRKQHAKSLNAAHLSVSLMHFIYHKLHIFLNLLDFVTPILLLPLSPHLSCFPHYFPFFCAGGEIWPPVSVAGSVLCCDCLPEICINKLLVPACPRCCPGARTFAYRAVIGLPWVPSATAERVGGRQHHKWVLNWNLTAALHFMCVEARSTAENDRREGGKR